MAALGALAAALLGQLLLVGLVPLLYRLPGGLSARLAALPSLQLALRALPVGRLAALLAVPLLLALELPRLGVRPLALLGTLLYGLVLPAGGPLAPVRTPVSTAPALGAALLGVRLGPSRGLLSRRVPLARPLTAPFAAPGAPLLAALSGTGLLARGLSAPIASALAASLLLSATLLLSVARLLPAALPLLAALPLSHSSLLSAALPSVLLFVVVVVGHGGEFRLVRSLRVDTAPRELRPTVRTPDGRG